MLRVAGYHTSRIGHTGYAAFTLSFASLGDALLYPVLPQYAAVMGIPVVWIGVLLSINRLIRIFFNPIVLRLYAHYGVRATTIAATAVAILSTAGYGAGWGLLFLVVCRLAWGMAFAVLRTSVMAYAFEQERIGISLGAGRSIQELGPLFSLWVGPVFLQYFSVTNTFYLLTILSLPALWYALLLPALHYRHARVKIQLRLPTRFNSITLLVAFLVEGLLIVMLGYFLSLQVPQQNNWMIASLAAALLAYRRISGIVISPIAGLIADQYGFEKVFTVAVFMIIAGVVVILSGWEMFGLVIIFGFSSVTSSMAPGGASANQSNKIGAVSANATWRDIGAATGTLTGGFILGYSMFSMIVIITASVILAGLLLFNFKSK